MSGVRSLSPLLWRVLCSCGEVARTFHAQALVFALIQGFKRSVHTSADSADAPTWTIWRRSSIY